MSVGADAGLPVVCDACGWRGRFPSLIGGSGSMSLVGNLVECPRCHRDARIVDGDYEMSNDMLVLKSGPASSWREFAQILADERWTRERVEQVAQAVNMAREGARPEAVVTQVARVDPQLGLWIRQMLADPSVQGGAALISMMAGLLALLLQIWPEGDDKPEPPAITQIVNQTFEGDPNSDQSPTPELPRPRSTSPTPTSRDPEQ